MSGAYSVEAKSVMTLHIGSQNLLIEEFWQQYKDVLLGFRLHVTLGLRTPLQYLESYGAVCKIPSEAFEVPPEYGIWLPYIGETMIESTMATEFGPVSESYAIRVIIPFLKEYRKIIESDLSPTEKFQSLINVGESHPIWVEHMALKPNNVSDNLGEMWALSNLTALNGIGSVKARKLIAQEIYTEEDLLTQARRA